MNEISAATTTTGKRAGSANTNEETPKRAKTGEEPKTPANPLNVETTTPMTMHGMEKPTSTDAVTEDRPVFSLIDDDDPTDVPPPAGEPRTLGSIISLLPEVYRFGITNRKGPNFALLDGGPSRNPPSPPKTKTDLTMIDVGFVADDCPPVQYKSCSLDRAGQVACARVILGAGTGQEYKLCSKSGPVLPDNMIYFFDGYTPEKITNLVAIARENYGAYWLEAQKEYVLAYHSWYWARFVWEVNLILHALQFGGVVWTQGSPRQQIAEKTGETMKWTTTWRKLAVTTMKKEYGEEPQEKPDVSKFTELPPPNEERELDEGPVRFELIE
jgi:hypothetical protein